jgi:ATP/maltotriose-dependent transcriptional regulator MalT
LELAQQAFGLVERGGERALLLEGHHAMWSSLIGLGRSAETAEHCRHGVKLYDRREQRAWWPYGTHDPGVCARHILGVSSWLLGRPDAAVNSTQEALDLAGDLGHDFTTMVTLYMGALVHYQRGETELAADKASAAVAIGDAHGFAAWPPRSAFIAGAALVERSRVKEGLAAMQDAVDRVSGMGLKGWTEVFSATVLAQAYGKAGQSEKGLEALDKLPTLTGIGFYEPEVRRVRGELLLAQSPHATTEAKACFQAALEMALARQERSLALRAAMSLASLLQRSGEREPARTVLAPVYASFDEGFDTADLRRARALLEECG